MSKKPKVEIFHLRSSHVSQMRSLLHVFSRAFDDPEAYAEARPSSAYLEGLLKDNTLLALVAICADEMVGGLVAYELIKFERERSEIYIYDLAVLEGSRRAGIATALIEHLKAIASRRGINVIYVQADTSDVSAVQLYSSLGTRQDVFHFDITPERN